MRVLVDDDSGVARDATRIADTIRTRVRRTEGIAVEHARRAGCRAPGRRGLLGLARLMTLVSDTCPMANLKDNGIVQGSCSGAGRAQHQTAAANSLIDSSTLFLPSRRAMGSSSSRARRKLAAQPERLHLDVDAVVLLDKEAERARAYK
jgi:hypothetical protein